MEFDFHGKSPSKVVIIASDASGETTNTLEVQRLCVPSCKPTTRVKWALITCITRNSLCERNIDNMFGAPQFVVDGKSLELIKTMAIIKYASTTNQL